ncbi:MAG: type II toxin-antitoxin system VapC family toxin [Clostridiales bacterium]|jgi:PIN domain nuclease of toxin-antitoxin system|nr:type II toxin-antitoxin system VapC family toxin [Clostridiales bacterium]
MKILLDTHIVLWILSSSKRLSQSTIHIISEKKNQKFISLAAVWELAIKINRGKMAFEGGITGFLNLIQESDIEILHITPPHIEYLEKLPPIHQDPFDRIMVAQAMFEGMFFATVDSNVKKYDIMHI